MLVLSRDDARVYEFDEQSGEFSEPRPLVSGMLIRGQCGTLGTTKLVLYRGEGNQLELRCGRDTVSITANTHLELTSGTRRVLSLVTRGVTVLRVEYEPNEAADPFEDLTPFAEAEDEDFGLFVANVLRDAGRRKRIFMSPV